jgi:hypothetical protein
VEYMVKVRGQFKRRSTANNVEIYVPVPDDADSPKFRVSFGAHFVVQVADNRRALGLWYMLLRRVHLSGKSSNWEVEGIT